MESVKGYIDINKILNIEGISDITEIDKLKEILDGNPDVEIESYDYYLKQIVFSFWDKGTKYYFKYTYNENIFNELVVEEIAKDMGIECLSYRLAKLGNFEGLISENFKKDKARYFTGREILMDCYGNDFHDESRVYSERNNLLDIWGSLEHRYNGRNNFREIVFKLVYKLIKILILDMMVGQYDRHSCNWGIVEYDNGDVDIQILYDNMRSLYYEPESAQLLLTVDDWSYAGLGINLDKFINGSSSYFGDMLRDNLWVIGRENVLKIFERIEEKTGSIFSEEMKTYYGELLNRYYTFIKDKIYNNGKKLKNEC